MKRIIATLIALITIAYTSHAQYRTTDTTFVHSYYAGASVDTNYVTWSGQAVRYVSRWVRIRNHATNASDTLWFWFDNDSTKYKSYLLKGETYEHTQLIKSINTRRGDTTNIRRPIEIKAQ